MSSGAICSLVPDDYKERPPDQPPLPQLTKLHCQSVSGAGLKLWWSFHLTEKFNFPAPCVCIVIYICTKFPDLVVFSLAHFVQVQLVTQFVSRGMKQSCQEVL